MKDNDYVQMQALEMRAEGKVYKRPKKRQATETSKSAIANPSAKMQNQPKYAADEEGSKPEGSVQVFNFLRAYILTCLRFWQYCFKQLSGWH